MNPSCVIEMSKMDGSEGLQEPLEVETPEAGAEKPAPEEAPLIPRREWGEEEEEMFRDVSDAGEVFLQRAAPTPLVQRLGYFLPPMHPVVSTPPPIKAECFDGTSNWWSTTSILTS